MTCQLRANQGSITSPYPASPASAARARRAPGIAPVAGCDGHSATMTSTITSSSPSARVRCAIPASAPASAKDRSGHRCRPWPISIRLSAPASPNGVNVSGTAR